jgi:ornithine decarboxylase
MAEIDQVLRLTAVDPSRIIFANPCKQPSHIAGAMQAGVRMMSVDCVEELRKIRNFAPAHAASAQLMLRLAVDDSMSLCRLNNKFGCREVDAVSILKEARALDLDVVGLSFHVGSACSNPVSFKKAIEACRRVALVARSLGRPIRILDVGGGFPGDDLDLFEACAAQISTALAAGDEWQGIEVIAEPGRFFAQGSQVLVARIIGKKWIAHEQKYAYYINDGVYGSFNCIHNDHYKPSIVTAKTFLAGLLDSLDGDGERKKATTSEKNARPSIVYGPTCDGIDIVSDWLELPEDLEVGDALCVPNMGAYTSAAASDFNGYATTRRVYVENQEELATCTSSLERKGRCGSII